MMKKLNNSWVESNGNRAAMETIFDFLLLFLWVALWWIRLNTFQKITKKNEIRNFYHHFFFFFIHHLLSIVAVHNIIVVPFGKENRFSKYIQWVKQLRLINNHTRHTISSSSFSALLSSVVFILAFRIERRSEVAVVSHNNLIFIARHFNQLWNASDGMKICVT